MTPRIAALLSVERHQLGDGELAELDQYLAENPQELVVAMEMTSDFGIEDIADPFTQVALGRASTSGSVEGAQLQQKRPTRKFLRRLLPAIASVGAIAIAACALLFLRPSPAEPPPAPSAADTAEARTRSEILAYLLEI